MSPSSPSPRKRRRVFNDPGQAHELTFSCQQRLPLLSKDRTRLWFIEALAQARIIWKFELWAYVIMPEHAHILLLPSVPDYDISLILKSIKQSVSRRAINYLGATNPQWLQKLEVTWPDGRVEHRFWQQGGGYDRNIYRPATAWKIVQYIHDNPVRRGLVPLAVDWPWSGARYYAGMDDIVLELDGCPPSP